MDVSIPHGWSILIYYTVGSGRLCGVAEVLYATSTGTNAQPAPETPILSSDPSA
jgi:hypothetical protein